MDITKQARTYDAAEAFCLAGGATSLAVFEDDLVYGKATGQSSTHYINERTCK